MCAITAVTTTLNDVLKAINYRFFTIIHTFSPCNQVNITSVYTRNEFKTSYIEIKVSLGTSSIWERTLSNSLKE